MSDPRLRLPRVLTFGHIDDVMRKVEQLEPDRAAVARRVHELLAALGLQVDEGTGVIVQKPAAVNLGAVPQQNVRWTDSGRNSRYRGRKR